MDAGRNWARNIDYAARELHRPTSIEELRRIVAGSRRLRPLGTRHSFTPAADTAGDLVEVTALPVRLDIDEDALTATVSAGSTYSALAPRLDAVGFALSNLAAITHVSVAGAISTGSHGSGDRLGSLASSVAAIELVSVDGELATLRRGDANFEGAAVSLGALGVITAVTLDLLPRYELRQQTYQGIRWDDLLERFDEATASGSSVSLSTTWTGDVFGDAVVKSAEELPAELLGRAQPTPRGELRPWHLQLPGPAADTTPSFGDELHSEWFVPRARAVEALTAIRSLGEDIAPHLESSGIRTVAADDLWLSGAFETDAVTVAFTWKPRAAEVRALLPRIEDLILPLGARPHWGKLFATQEMELLYPRLDDFRALADEWDPRGKLRNEWLDRLLWR